MRTPAYRCDYCGSPNLRRSRRQSMFELMKMFVGAYPFRCLDCNQRFGINIWLFSKLAYAKCPKCLGMELSGWPRKHYRLPWWKGMLATFGAHRYRCTACRCNFLSFRPSARPRGAAAEPILEDSAEPVIMTPETEGLPETKG